MGLEIKVDGTKRLRKRLEALDDHTRSDVLARIVMAAAEPVRAVAAQKAPTRTGKLVETMTTELLEQKPHRASAGVGPNNEAWYGIFAEYGTVNHSAQPFLRPAFDEQKRNVSQRMATDLRGEINRARKV